MTSPKRHIESIAKYAPKFGLGDFVLWVALLSTAAFIVWLIWFSDDVIADYVMECLGHRK